MSLKIKVIKIATRGLQGPSGISSVIDDTNVTGTVVGGALTLGWTGTLADNRIASAAAWNAKQPAGNYLTALSGDGTASGPGSAALTLATVNSSPGSFGSASKSLTAVVNAKGLITSLSEQSIQIAESQVTNLVSDLSGKQATGNYITGLTGDITATGPGSASSSIGAGKVTNAMLAGSIAYSKLSLTSSIVDSDVAPAAAIAWTKISKSGSSLADLATRSATDLSSGTLPDGRLSTNVVLIDGSRPFTSAISGIDPSIGTHLATKNYVDAAVTGFDAKASVRAASTANLTLSGAQTIDGVSVIAGDRVLAKDQSTASQNGIYVAASGAWSRSSDADANAEVTSGLFTFVEEGTVNANTGWVLTTANPITVGSTSLSFVQFSGLGEVVAGTGLSKSGNTIQISTGYIGQSSITTLGTIAAGVWQSTKIGLAFGGTNADLSGTGGAGQYLKQNSAGGTITVSAVADSELTFTDITTNNASSSKHGFLPKLSGSSTDALRGDGTWGAGANFANPTASIGLAVVNGSAATAMRSDAAPALDQSIAPTWSGNHRFNGFIGVSTAPDSTHTTGAVVKIAKTGLDLSTDAYIGISVSMTGGNTPAGEHLGAGSFTATASSNSTNTGGPQAIFATSIVNASVTASQAYSGTFETQIFGTIDSAWGCQNQVAVLSGGTVSTIAYGTTSDVVSVGTILNATAFLGTLRKLSSGTITGVMKGLDLSGWSGSPATSYGIYMDSSIDRGTTKYSIYSLSASPSLLSGDFQHAPTARASGVLPYFKITIPSDTTLTASTEAPGFQVVSATRQWSTGAITEQREHILNAPTYGFVGASTVTRAANLYASSPIQGTNATLTKSISAMFEASAAAHVPIYVRGAASQSGNLQEWANSSNSVLAGVTPAGFLFDVGTTRVSTQFDKTNTTLADVTGLSAPVEAGQSYSFRAVLFLTLDATGLGKIAFGGTATATNLIAGGYGSRGAGAGTLSLGTISALATAFTGLSTSAITMVVVEGEITVNAAGTFTVQFAQSAGPNGTSSVLVGSTFTVSRA